MVLAAKFNSDQQKSLKDERASGKQQATGIRPPSGVDVIKKLGGVHIDEGSKAHFAEAAHNLGATIELEQPDFCAEFD